MFSFPDLARALATGGGACERHYATARAGPARLRGQTLTDGERAHCPNRAVARAMRRRMRRHCAYMSDDVAPERALLQAGAAYFRGTP